MKFILFAAFVMFAFGGCTSMMPPPNARQAVRILAASSLTDAVTDAGIDFEKSHSGIKIEYCFAASGQLKAQIENGAPSDVFVSASAYEMDALSNKGLIIESSRAVLTSNVLVLIARETTRLNTWEDLARGDVKRIAIANPASVPAGRYAKATLTHRNLWNVVSRKTVYGENVRQVLKYVQTGDVDAGVVFRSDVHPKGCHVRIIDVASNGVDHVCIEYAIAVLRHAQNPGSASKFVKFLLSNQGQKTMLQHGFTSASSSKP